MGKQIPHRYAVRNDKGFGAGVLRAKRQVPDAKCQVPSAKCQMPIANR
jgi:hypothetical protein